MTTLAVATLAVFAVAIRPARAESSPVGFICRPSEAADLKGDRNGIGRFNRNEANKHLVKLFGSVTAISDTSITIMSRQEIENSREVVSSSSYTFSIDATTKVLRRFRAASSVNEMAVGDHVRIWATKLSGGNAQLIWDKSIWWVRQTGTISSIDMTQKTFTLLMNRTSSEGTTKTFSVAIHATTSTVFVMPDGSAGSFAALANGDLVRVRGVWNHLDRFVTAGNIKFVE